MFLIDFCKNIKNTNCNFRDYGKCRRSISFEVHLKGPFQLHHVILTFSPAKTILQAIKSVPSSQPVFDKHLFPLNQSNSDLKEQLTEEKSQEGRWQMVPE